MLNCLRSKNSIKQGKIFEFLKLTAEPMLWENLKRSCTKSWKVMAFAELTRVRTLSARPRVILASTEEKE